VTSNRLRAVLSAGGDSQLDKAYADGAVTVVETAAGRPARTGSGDHGEYYEAEQKVVLDGKPAHMVDGDNTSDGLELTYWTNDARLLVNGTPKEPVKTRITRDPKKSK
jgi:lipopolysaccharide export system protein LptA